MEASKGGVASLRYGPDWLHEKIAAGKHVIIDGGMGTELEARDVPMNEQAWSGAALLSHPDVVRAIHADYVAAGAEVIITNTFAAGHQVLTLAGLGDEVAHINRKAVEVAIQARDESAEQNVAIAGSMSVWMQPGITRPEKRVAEEFREQADILATAGVDLIALEMCSHPVYSPLIIEAAVATGLPVWLGLSCKQDADAGLVGFDPPNADFRELVANLVDCGAGVINIMHSNRGRHYGGSLGAQRLLAGPLGRIPGIGIFHHAELAIRRHHRTRRSGATGAWLVG